jgi:hypothetical protein
MYSLRDTVDLAKLVSKDFKGKFRHVLVHIIVVKQPPNKVNNNPKNQKSGLIEP